MPLEGNPVCHPALPPITGDKLALACQNPDLRNTLLCTTILAEMHFDERRDLCFVVGTPRANADIGGPTAS